jgi:hypothetical protein
MPSIDDTVKPSTDPEEPDQHGALKVDLMLSAELAQCVGVE